MAWVEPQYCNTDHALIPINWPELKGIKSISNNDLVVVVSLEVSYNIATSSLNMNNIATLAT